MHAEYVDPSSEHMVERQVNSLDEIEGLVRTIRTLDGGRGHPALVLGDDSGSSLSIGIQGDRAVLTWYDPLGNTFHSVNAKPDGEMLVFDYLGSYTEVPDEFAVSVQEAVQAAGRYLDTGSPESADLILEPD